MRLNGILTDRCRDNRWIRHPIVWVYILILLENPLTRLIPLFSYYDELLFVLVVLGALVEFKKGVSDGWARLAYQITLICFGMVVVGFIGSVVSGLQENWIATVKDAIAFLKFPIGLPALLLVLKNVDESTIEGCVRVSKAFVLICLFIGLVNLIYPMDAFCHDARHGIESFTFIYSHPTYLVCSLVLCYAFIAREHKGLGLYELACFFVLALTMRDKAFGFIALAVLFSLVGIERRKNVLLYFVLAAVGVLIVAWPKISLYISYPNSPREAMYSAAIDLAMRMFPVGAGFGTIASSISGEYYSRVYFDYGIDVIPDMTPGNYSAVGDAGYAYYLGVFGIVGFVMFFILLYLLYRYLISEHPLGSRVRYSVLILFGYILLALTVETTLTNPSGMELAFVLALLGCRTPEPHEKVDVGADAGVARGRQDCVW